MYDTVKGADWPATKTAIEYMLRERAKAVYELDTGAPFSRRDDGKSIAPVRA